MATLSTVFCSKRMTSPMYGSIHIRGARDNNLKNVSLDILKRKITVFTGVSGYLRQRQGTTR